MTGETAIALLNNLRAFAEEDDEPAIDMAIEAIQFIEHFDLLKEYQSLQEVVRCKDCKHRREICPMYYIEMVGEDERIHDYSTDNGYCSWGERKGGEEE